MEKHSDLQGLVFFTDFNLKKRSTNTGLIVGCVVAILVILILIIGAAIYRYRKRKRGIRYTQAQTELGHM